MTTKNIGLYLSNLFPPQNATPAQLAAFITRANDIGTAGFTTGYVFNLNVDQLGNLSVYADSDFNHGLVPLISNGQLQPAYAAFPQIIGALRAGGRMTRVFFTIGAACWERDFTNIGNLIQNFGLGANNPLYANLQALQAAFTATGIDLDLEPAGVPAPPPNDPYTPYHDAVVGFSRMVGSLGMEVTFCPFLDRTFWLGCLATIYQEAGRQIVTGLNLQYYGNSETQIMWVESIQGYKNKDGIKIPLGIENPSAFVNVGLKASVSSPKDAQTYFSTSANFAPGAQSGWLYDSGGIAPGPSSYGDYAQAIIAGLDALPLDMRGAGPR